MEFAFEKHFTLEEANALIPAVRVAFEKIRKFMDPSKESDSGPAEGNGRSNGNGNGNGHHRPISPEERVEKANQLLHAVSERGIVIQDWRRGLIDFPHILDGREVFLCYELSDGGEVKFYHEIDAGFAGRKPLD